MSIRHVIVTILFFTLSISFIKFGVCQEDIGFEAPEYDQEIGLMKDIQALTGEDPTALIPNTDPSGIDDNTAVDETGNPIEFNLHVPPDFTIEVPLAEIGLKKASPEDDLASLLDQMIVEKLDKAERKLLVKQALDILLGTNESGNLDDRAYKGFPLLNINSGNEEKIKRVSEWNNTNTFDEDGNVDINLLYFGKEIDSDTYLLEIPPAFMVQPFTIKYTINNVVGFRCFAPTVMCQLPNPNFPAEEDALPFGKFSNGPPSIPYAAYDASFYEIDRLIDEEGRQRSEQGTQTQIVLAMPPAKFIKGIYTWGWRKHPPLTQFTVVIPEGELLPDGKTLSIDAFATGQANSIEDISDQAPEKIIFKALKEFNSKIRRKKISKKVIAIIENVKEQINVMKDKLTLPPGFEKDVTADFTAVYMNGETYVESQEKGGPQNNWILPRQNEGDIVNGTIINADNIKSFFRTVIFAKGQVQYGTPVDSNHNEFGNFNWKPIYGNPLFVAGGWKSEFAAIAQQDLYTDEDDVGDLQHDYENFSGFSGPVVPGMFEGPMGSDSLFDYGFGKPIEPGATLNATIEMPRNLGGNRSVLYLFDPMRHDNSVFSLHTP